MVAYTPNSVRLASIKNALVVCFAVLVAALAFIVWQQRLQIRALSIALTHAADRAVTVRDAVRRSVALPPLSPPVVRNLDEARPADDTLETALRPTPHGMTTRTAAANALARLLDNPEFHQLLALQRQAAVDTRFAALFRRLALGPDELASFKRLLAEKDSVALDVLAVSESQPDGPLSPAALDASVNAARAQVENAIRSALGSERYAVYREYEQTLPQRMLVAQLEQRLSYSAAPLAPVQAEALVKIFVAQAPVEPAGALASAVAVGKSAPSAVVPLLANDPPPARLTDAALAQAQAVLAPAQHAALRDLQTEQRATTRAMEILRDTLPVGDSRLGVPLQIFLQ